MSAVTRARAYVEDRPWLLLLLLAPFLCILPPVPVDETRYLSIAWEMRQSGDFIALQLNGFAYFDKPPLLFWLLNLQWSLFGTSLWSSRLLPLLCGAACVALVQKLARQLGSADARHAPWLLLGCLYFQLFAGVVMFDVLLCGCVLLAFVGAVAWLRAGSRSGLMVLFAGGALGMLAKGPVVLLHLLPPLLLTRWWLAPSGERPSPGRIAAALAVAVASGVPVLLWALAAVRHRALADARELIVTQTAGRVLESFAHERPPWWYLQWLLPLLLPWPLVLRWRRLGAAFKAAGASCAARFGGCAAVPAFVAFSVVSGKQLHYLLPLLPGMALWLGEMARLDQRLLHGRRMLAFCVLVLGAAVWTLLHAGDKSAALLLSFAAIVAATVLAWRERGAVPERRMACVMLLLVVALLPIIHRLALASMDLRGLADTVVELRQRGVPVVRAGHEPGLITFLARLPAPLPTTDDPARWAQEHPQGYVLLWSAHALPQDIRPRVRAGNGWAGLRPAATFHPGQGAP